MDAVTARTDAWSALRATAAYQTAEYAQTVANELRRRAVLATCAGVELPAADLARVDACEAEAAAAWDAVSRTPEHAAWLAARG